MNQTPECFSQNQLILRILSEVSELSSSDLESVDKKNFPPILYHGFDPSEAGEIVKSNAVNASRSLRWFSRSYNRASLAYGFSIPEDVIEAQRAEGIVNSDGSFTDEYLAESIKSGCRLVIVLFPKKINSRWVVAKNQPTVFDDSDEYITDSTIPLSDVVVTTLGRLRATFSNKPHRIESRDELLTALGISEEDQNELWLKIKKFVEE